MSKKEPDQPRLPPARKSIFFKIFSPKDGKPTTLLDVIRELEEEQRKNEELDLLDFLNEDVPTTLTLKEEDSPVTTPPPMTQKQESGFGWFRRSSKNNVKEKEKDKDKDKDKKADGKRRSAHSQDGGEGDLSSLEKPSSQEFQDEAEHGERREEREREPGIEKDRETKGEQEEERERQGAEASRGNEGESQSQNEGEREKEEVKEKVKEQANEKESESEKEKEKRQEEIQQVPQKTARELVLEQRAAIAEKKARFLKLLKEQAERDIKTRDFAFSPQDPRHWGEKEPIRFSKDLLQNPTSIPLSLVS